MGYPNGRRRLANEVRCPRCHTHRPRGVTTCPGLINKKVDGNFVIRKCADYPNGRRRLVQVCRKCTHMSSFEGRGGPKAMHMSNFEDWKAYKDTTPVKCGVMTPKRYKSMKLQKQ